MGVECGNPSGDLAPCTSKSAFELSNSENRLRSAADSRDSIAPANCDAVVLTSAQHERQTGA